MDEPFTNEELTGLVKNLKEQVKDMQNVITNLELRLAQSERKLNVFDALPGHRIIDTVERPQTVDVGSVSKQLWRNTSNFG